jgi:hypothetical protein
MMPLARAEEIPPLLGAGFGKVIEVEGKILDEADTRRLGDAGAKLIEVSHVGGVAVDPVAIPLELEVGAGELPARGTAVRFRGYETGGFLGTPREAFADLKDIATTQYFFQSRFAVIKQLEAVRPAVGTPAAAAEKPLGQASRDAAAVLPQIQQLLGGVPTYPALTAILGKPDGDLGSGLHIYVFALSDGSKITVATADGQSLFFVDHDKVRLYPAL